MNKSIILSLDLEEAFLVVAYRTHLGSLLAYDDASAVAADPDCVAVAGEFDSLLDVLEQLAVTLLMMTLYLADSAEFACDFGEALLVGLACHTIVHVGPLVVLTLCGVLEIGHCVGYLAAVEIFVPELGVLLLVVGCLLEDGCYLLITVLACLRCEVCIFVPGNGFPRRTPPAGCARSLFLSDLSS